MKDIEKRLAALEATPLWQATSRSDEEWAASVEEMLRLGNDPATRHEVPPEGGLTYGERAERIMVLLDRARARMEAQ